MMMEAVRVAGTEKGSIYCVVIVGSVFGCLKRHWAVYLLNGEIY